MIDAKKLIDQLLGAAGGAGPAPAGGQGAGGLGDVLSELGSAFGGAGGGASTGTGGSSGGLGGILGDLGNALGGAGKAPAGGEGTGGGLGDILGGTGGGIGEALGKVQDYARQNPVLASVVAGGLATVLLGAQGNRKLATNTVKYGGLAAVAALAYKAWRDHQAGQQKPAGATALPLQPEELLPPPSDSPFAAANAPQGEDAFALALVSVMIAAAKADGHVDEAERQAILGRLAEGGLDAEEQAFLARELSGPSDIEKIVAAAKTKEQAIQLYATALMAIEPDQPAERAWLTTLAARLDLEPELAKTIEDTIAQALV